MLWQERDSQRQLSQEVKLKPTFRQDDTATEADRPSAKAFEMSSGPEHARIR